MGAIEITGAIVGLCYLYYEYHASLRSTAMRPMRT